MLPVVRILAFWILGILSIPFLNCTDAVLLYVLLLAKVLFLGFYNIKSLYNKYFENLLLFIIVIGLVKLFSIHGQKTIDLNAFYNKENRVLLKVKERYKTTAYNYKYIVDLKVIQCDSVVLIQQDCLLMQANDSLTKAFYPGDVFWCDVYFTPIIPAKHEALFDASKYWGLKGISENLWLKNENIHFLEPELSWFYLIRREQVKWLEILDKQGLNESTKQIISALVLGNKTGVSKQIYSTFTNLGLIHTLALSGLHISLIYGICALFLSLILKYKPKLQSVLLVLIILTYAVLTGLSPSVMRASVMFLLYAFSLAINRRTTAFNIVFLSALILLIYQPNFLFDIGFQLSYLAVLGILYFYKFFQVFIEKQNYLKRFILSLALVSIAAQLSVGLLSVYYFHSFPISFLWSNIIVLPYITILLYSSVAYLSFVVMGFKIQFMNDVLDALVGGLLSILSIIEEYSFSAIEVFISQVELYYYYGLLIGLCLVFLEKRFKGLYFLYTYILIGILGFIYLNQEPTQELFINASKQVLVISITANNEQIIISDNQESTAYLLGDYSLRNSIHCIDTIPISGYLQNSFCKIENNLIQYSNKKLLVLGVEKINANTAVKIDVLLMKSDRNDIKEIQKVLSPDVILLDACLSSMRRENIKRQWQEFNVILIDLSERVYVDKC